MSDLRKELHAHYEAKSLPPERVEAILAAGRAAAANRAVGEEIQETMEPKAGRWFHSWRVLALAAAGVLLFGVASIWLFGASRANYAAVPTNVIEFFAGKPVLRLMSEDPEALHTWAVNHGAPSEFEIPAKLKQLAGKGCTILHVDGKPAYLLCFMTGMDSKTGGPNLVHLVVTRRINFRNAPASGVPSFSTSDGWSFASWSEGEVVYTVALKESPTMLRRFLTMAFSGSRPKAIG